MIFRVYYTFDYYVDGFHYYFNEISSGHLLVRLK